MPNRKANATWEGSLQTGKGRMKLGSGAFDGPFAFQTRMGDEPGTNPEELIGAALAGCFSMALSLGLGQAGAPPQRIQTTAAVKLEKQGDGFAITHILLRTEAQVAGLDAAKFQEIAEQTKKGCPVSKALSAVKIDLEAKLLG